MPVILSCSSSVKLLHKYQNPCSLGNDRSKNSSFKTTQVTEGEINFLNGKKSTPFFSKDADEILVQQKHFNCPFTFKTLGRYKTSKVLFICLNCSQERELAFYSSNSLFSLHKIRKRKTSVQFTQIRKRKTLN